MTLDFEFCSVLSAKRFCSVPVLANLQFLGFRSVLSDFRDLVPFVLIEFGFFPIF